MLRSEFAVTISPAEPVVNEAGEPGPESSGSTIAMQASSHRLTLSQATAFWIPRTKYKILPSRPVDVPASV
jgi:hypothetical protein